MDKAHKDTDEKLQQMEKHLAEIYSKSVKQIGASWTQYLKEIDKEIASLEDEYAEAKQSGVKELIEKKGRALADAKQRKTIQNKRFHDLSEQLAAELTNVNKTALAYINGELPAVYALNYNALDGEIAGYSLTLTDANTVKLLATTDKDLLPYKYLDARRDMGWNMGIINSEVLQGILQGESMSKIADRLQNVGIKNQNSAIRNARTMVTGAENKGRQDSYVKATQDGVVMKRVWISTDDRRTRHTHRLLDGTMADVDKPFASELGEIMYPGDPAAEPANTYNCRCTLSAKIIGFKKLKPTEPKHYIAQGEDISETWSRRESEFNFEIEDVINAQGFDGVPRIVDANEFDKAVKKSNFIAQRSYSANDMEILKSYRDQLYSGKWYVDCSTGGSQFGQGMYCASSNGQSITDGMAQEMQTYEKVARRRGMTDTYVETFTIAEDAKFITYDDLKREFFDWKHNEENNPNSKYGWIQLSDMDTSTYAVLKGYDVILAGISPVTNTQYSVILNRTKVIFKRSE